MSLFHILNLHERKCACWWWLLLLNPYPGSDSYFAILRWRACTASRAGGPWGVCCSAPRATKRSCPELKHVHADPPRQVASPSPSHLPLLAIAAPNYTCWQRDVPVSSVLCTAIFMWLSLCASYFETKWDTSIPYILTIPHALLSLPPAPRFPIAFVACSLN